MSANAFAADAWLRAWLRPGSTTARDVQRDLLWLLGIGLVLIASGIGLRDPWPADEPRFALIARDMVATGDWLLPRIGGEVYADKPPLFFWLMALCIQLTGSLRAGFLLPSLFSGLACVVLVYDLARRLWNRETGFLAGLALLFTVQFVWQARQAQIDATLCFRTTLSLYGLLRHLLLGPQWRWYVVGWAAAGFGVITKGVGFLPLLVLIPFALLRAPQWTPRLRTPPTARWLLGPLAFVGAVSLWLVPMLLAARGDPTLAAYRDEILFMQTVDRYTNAWHHREPFWYFILEVIPWLWLPLTALLPWLVPQWRRALRDRDRDMRIALLAAWAVLVILFFSISTGKRGVYVLPVLPAFVLMCAPYLHFIATRVAAQRLIFSLAALIAGACSLAAVYVLIEPTRRFEVIHSYDIDPLAPLVAIAIAGVIACVLTGPRRGFLAFGCTMTCVLLIVSFWINPALDASRSGRAFIERVESVANPRALLGFVGFKEQYLLHARRPVVHFGHARWREGGQELWDAARWLAAGPARQLVVEDVFLKWCFPESQHVALGNANRSEWYLVRGAVNRDCINAGRPNVAQSYNPPGARPAKISLDAGLPASERHRGF